MTLEDSARTATDRRVATPERASAQKRTEEIDRQDRPPKIQKNDDDDDMTTDSVVNRRILSAILRGVDITEVYSPVRVAKACRELGLQAGTSFDLTTGWDFSKASHRKAAWERIRAEDPYVIVGSPPCTLFSVLQRLNLHNKRDDPRWLDEYYKAKAAAVKHIEFC